MNATYLLVCVFIILDSISVNNYAQATINGRILYPHYQLRHSCAPNTILVSDRC